MYKKSFCLSILILFFLVIIVVYCGYTDDWPDNNILLMGTEIHTDGHASEVWNPPKPLQGNGYTQVHTHCIAAAKANKQGFFNLLAKIEEADDAPWWVFWVGKKDPNANTFQGGCREFASANNTYTFVKPKHLVWTVTGSITDQTTGETKTFMKKDPNDNDVANNGANNNNLGISPTDPNQSPSPGEAYEVRLVTEVPYYFVDWYVKAPWDTSERGTHEEYDPGDGTLTEATFRYTFPSGAMHTGDFLITAVYYLWSSDTSEYEETYTVTVSLD